MKCSLVSLIFLNRSLVFPILLFSSASLHWSLRKAFLSLLAILWNSAFRWEYLSFSPLLFASLLFTAICKASSDTHFAFFHFFPMGMVLIPVSCTEHSEFDLCYVVGCISSLFLFTAKQYLTGHTILIRHIAFMWTLYTLFIILLAEGYLNHFWCIVSWFQGLDSWLPRVLYNVDCLWMVIVLYWSLCSVICLQRLNV